MKTTVVVDDAVMKAAKKRAAELGLSLSAYLEQALRADLRDSARPATKVRIELPVFRGRPAKRSITPAEIRALLVDED